MTDDERKLLQQTYLGLAKLTELISREEVTQEDLIVFLNQLVKNTHRAYDTIFADPKYRRKPS